MEDALKLPVLRRGIPEVVAHEAGLSNEIRWVHVAEVANIASLLQGGELLLTTGMGFDRTAASQRRLVRELADRGIAALVIELGTSLTSVPSGLRSAAEDYGLCLVALDREIRFVEVTEAIHRLLIDQGGEAIREADRLHRRFTALMLGGAGVPDVLSELAHFVRNPVFLERSGAGVVYHACHESDGETAMGAWATFSRGLATAPGAVEEQVPLGGEDSWGRLVALGIDNPLSGSDRVAVERAVGLIALALMRKEEEDQLSTRERGNFLAGLVTTRAAESEIAARAIELGFAGSWSSLLPAAATVPAADFGSDARAASVAVKRDVRRELERERIPVLLGDGDADELLLILGLQRAEDRGRIADLIGEITARVADRRLGREQATVCVAAASSRWLDAGAGLRLASSSLEAASHETRRPWHDVTAPSPDRLLFSLRNSDNLRQFTSQRLRPLLEADERGRGDLVLTLATLCDNAGRRVETAAALGIKRQTLYHRLNRIEAATGCGLSDGDVLLSFHIALRAHRFLEQR